MIKTATPFTLAITLLAILSPIAKAQETKTAKPSLTEIQELVHRAEKYHYFAADEISRGGIEMTYIDALIAAQRFDDVFAKIKIGYLDSFGEYCVAKLVAGQPEGLPQQIDEVASIREKHFAPVELKHFKERFGTLKVSAEVLQKVKANEEGAIALAVERWKEKESHGHLAPNPFWVHSVEAAAGEEALLKFVDRAVESIEDETQRIAEKENLLILRQPRSEQLKYGKRRRAARYRKQFKELNDGTEVPTQDWFSMARSVLQPESGITQAQRDELVSEMLNRLQEDKSLPDNNREWSRWHLLKIVAENGNWPLVLQVIEQHPPGPAMTRELGKLCLLTGLENPDRLGKLVNFLPDADGPSYDYTEDLLDLLLLAGHVDKAQRNVHALGEGPAEIYRNKIAFYQLLHDSQFKGIARLAAMYTSFESDTVDNIRFITRDLGTGHLAEIAIKNSPAAALQLARAIPQEAKYNDQNAFGLCASPLIRRKKFDLARDVAALATAAEIEHARLKLSREDIANIDDEDWKRLEELAPNDIAVLKNLIRIAIADQDKARSLMLAKRALIHHRSFGGTEALFANAGWHAELIELSGTVTKDLRGTPYYKNAFQKLTALTVGENMPFKNADEAIDFSRTYLKRGDPGARLLLYLAVKWAEK